MRGRGDTEVIDQRDNAPETGAELSALDGELAAVLDAVADGVTVQDSRGRVVYANAAAVRLIGFGSVDELLRTAPADITDRFELFDERGAPLSIEALPGRRALRGQAEPEATVGFRIKASGDVRWATVRATPLVVDGGRVAFAINTFHDITDRVRMETEVRSSEQRYRQLVEAMPQIAWMTDRTGAVVLVNRRWVEYTGDEGRSGAGFETERVTHPDDLPAVAQGWLQALGSGETFEAACRLRRHDGQYRWHLVRAVAVRDLGGAVEAWIGTSTDIDDARHAEDGLRLLARASERFDVSLDLSDIVEAATELAVPQLGDWAAVDLVGSDGGLRRAAAAGNAPGTGDSPPSRRAGSVDSNGDDPAAEAIRTGRPVVVRGPDGNDAAATAAKAGAGSGRQRRPSARGLAVPLIARGRTLGVLQLASGPSGRRYDEPDVELAVAFAGRIALAGSNAVLYAEQQHAREGAEAAAFRTDLLARVARALVGAFTRDEVLELVLRDGLAALGASGGVVVMRSSDASEIEVVAAQGLDERQVRRWHRIRLDDDVPLAMAVSEARPVWIGNYTSADGFNEEVRAALRASPNRASCTVPILVEGRAVGALGFTFRDPQSFDPDTQRYITAYADLAAQAIERVSLSEARESLLAGLDEQRARLETVLRQMPAGVVIAEAPSGRILLMNESVEQIWRGPMLKAASVGEYADYVGFHADGRQYEPQEWPLARAIVAGEVVTGEEIAIQRRDGSRGWIVSDASPIRDRDGRIVAGVVTFSDITERRLRQEYQRFLADAAEMLGSSLDYEETIGRVAELAVPGVADWCVVDIVDDDGRIGWAKIAHADPTRLALAERFRERYPPDPEAPTGVSAVIRNGRAEMMSDIPPGLVEKGARDAEHRAMLRDLELRSYMCVPLRSGDRTFGAITFIGAGTGRRFSADDLVFAEDLAARAAAAIERARLFREIGQYKRLVDASLDAVFLIDPETLRYTYANDGAVEQLGLDRTTLLTLGPSDVTADLDPERLAEIIAPLVDRSVDSRTITVAHRHADGRLIPVEVLLQYVEFEPEPGRIVAIARDISERVDAQARLQRLAEAEHARAAELNAVIRAIGDGIIVCEAGGRVRLVNPAAGALFPGVTLRTFDTILAQFDDPAGQAPALGVRGGPIELRVLAGEERWVELSTYPVAARPAAEGQTDGGETIVLLRDITEARQRQAVRDTFLGVLSHELRTPITTIFGASQVLAKPDSTLPDETRREIFDDIRLEAERLHRLVEDVIALTRFGEERGEVGNEPVLLQRVLPNVVRSEEPRWPTATFRLSVPVGLPTVVADPTYVEQVVRNLLSNAAKYGGSRAVIEVDAIVEGDEVAVRILDNGPGFPEAEADRLFDLFFRSESTAGHATGAGIGLFVCARLIGAMGGRIWARPRPEGGAEFGFSLRVMDDD